ncbi:MAG: adenine deaminase [Bacillota bacterium]
MKNNRGTRMNEAAQKIKRRLAVARGEEPAALLLKNAKVVNVFSGEIIKGNVAIDEGFIAAVGEQYTEGKETIDLKGKYIAPGLIDAHLHVESTLLLPPELGRVIAAHGTTAVINDPHEIANVLGADGVKLMLEASEEAPCDFFATVPSSVPSTDMETAGGEINSAMVKELLAHPRVVGLGEMMNYPGVTGGDEEALKKIVAAEEVKKVIDGHAPAVTGSGLQAYLSAGISTDHESITAGEASEKLAGGMKIIIRHGSATSSLQELLSLVNPTNSDSFMFGSDDREAGELLEKGHVNEILRSAVSLGMDPLLMIKIASLNAARHYRLYDRGAVAPGYRADLVVFDDLQNFRASLVFKDGRKIARDGVFLAPETAYELSPAARDSVKLKSTIKEEDFRLQKTAEKIPVIGVVSGQLVTEKLFLEVESAEDGFIAAKPAPEINKIAVIERHGKSGRVSVGLIKGFGLEQGALASSVAHDSHNLVVVGASEKAMAAAVNELARTGGGFVAVDNEASIKACLPLQAAGLMSTENASVVAEKMAAVLKAAGELGTKLPQPFLTLSFMALPVIPALKITDRGLVDVDSFAFI